MKTTVWGLIALLVVLHQDYWQWTDTTLIFGFLPYTLLYHSGISVAAATLWFLATKFCWPEQLDDLDETGGPPGEELRS